MSTNASGKTRIVYIIPIRGNNPYRKKNLKVVLEWILTVKDFLDDNYGVSLDICVIEQDHEPRIRIQNDKVTHYFLNNPGTFNKGWGFNVVVKQLPNYQYYGFADADIVVPEISVFCEQLVQHCVVVPQKVFRPFGDRLDTNLVDVSIINHPDDLVKMLSTMQPKLTRHDGLSFASNMIFMNKETYDQIGGWEESFRGWGRYDDFITYKLSFLCQLNEVYSPNPAIHLWHPVTLDYSLSSDNVLLYDKYLACNRDDLLKVVEKNR